MSGSLPPAYFDRMYAGDDDPWGFRSRWYEERKRALTLAALTRRRYRRVFEPGCSLGLLTEGLAQRADQVLATDVAEAVLRQARARLGQLPTVRVERIGVPQEWPSGTFDLILLSEMGYYLSDDDLATLATRAAASLDDGGTLLAVHWRHPVADYPLTGDDVHEVLGAAAGLRGLVRHVEDDFRLDLWIRGTVRSVAAEEGLVS